MEGINNNEDNMKHAIISAKGSSGETTINVYFKRNRLVSKRRELRQAKDILLKMGYSSIEIEYLTKQEFNKRIEETEREVYIYPPLPQQ